MRLKIFFLFGLFTLLHVITYAQEAITYQQPAQEILELADAKLPPVVQIDAKGEYMILLERSQYKSIEEMSEPELRIGGLRINPTTNIYSRTRFYNQMSIQKVGDKKPTTIEGLPEKPRLASISWSPDQTKVAFTHTTQTGVELWVLDVKEAKAKKLTEAKVNANMRGGFTWFQDGSALLVNMIPEDRQPLKDRKASVPVGPRVSTNDGAKAQNRTYQDLLKDRLDEFNFEQLVRSTLFKVDLEGNATQWMAADMYSGVSFSPDGNYVMVRTIGKPFSYIVPYYRFPNTTKVFDLAGKLVATIADTPLQEEWPKGFGATQKGRRSIGWRSDQPATVYWVEALDEGDPSKEVPFRDEAFELAAPFDGTPKSIVKTINRFAGMRWGTNQVAIAYDRWFSDRNTKTYLVNPSDPKAEPSIIADRNYQDRYNDPGYFVTKKNTFGENVLEVDGDHLYLVGNGYSDEGIRPFVDKFNLKTKETVRLWRADGKENLEYVYNALDASTGTFLTRIESKTDYPNYYIRNIKSNDDPQAITFFENPFKSMEGVHKEMIKYKRDDGIELSGTLYLPAGYDKNKKEKLPMLLWAYPREYKDKATAGQITSSPHQFTSPYYGSPVFWVQRGYAVLSDAAFPIIGEGDQEPNDSFRKQLVANGKAAIDAVDAMGYIDRNRVGVGGHSYGAFMTANLLSHSDLFAAGIARSGAYNRTLTPFGFQSEERSYWEAPEVYYTMSPFMHADKMKTPLLLIHGEEDNNSGTYPLQSERYFNALKGLGATVRLVMLPKESHGYAARESILHMLWEQDQWLEKYVKNREMKEVKP